jgi:hypothetical protein
MKFKELVQLAEVVRGSENHRSVALVSPTAGPPNPNTPWSEAVISTVLGTHLSDLGAPTPIFIDSGGPSVSSTSPSVSSTSPTGPYFGAFHRPGIP